jgi:hypothetical protein
VVNQASGEVVVRSQRVPISAQRRNLVGVSLGACSMCFRLDVVQADNDSNETHFAAPVAAGHFRLIFAHAALTVPAATVVANDDITLLTVQPGGRGQLDHPLIPPHQCALPSSCKHSVAPRACSAGPYRVAGSRQAWLPSLLLRRLA